MYYMIHKTLLTKKGTTTIPAEVRKHLGVKPGMYISFTRNEKTGEYTIHRSQTIEEVRAMNKEALRRAGTSRKEYTSGKGFEALLKEKYGNKTS